MWKLSENGKKAPDIFSYSALLAKGKYDFMELFDNGYNDAKANKEFLDTIFGQNQ
jgi:predicted Ser/Thr protein kinase